MDKLGFIVPHLGASQLSYSLLRNINQAVANDVSIDYNIFYEDMQKPCINPGFCVLQIHEAYEYKYPLIATSFNTANKLIRFPGTTKKFFYVWDLEWLRPKSIDYNQLAEVYQNSELQLICRSNSHKKAVEDAWNVPVNHIVEQINLKKFMEIAYGV